MARSELEVEGQVTECLSNAKYRVKLDKLGTTVLCHPSGKMKTKFIRMVTGDRVKVALSEYDLTRGIITYRMK